MRLRIAIVVHGRFYAFDLARALIERGHDVTVFTNYPASIVARFGISRERVRSFVLHGVGSRLAWTLRERVGVLYPEATLHRLFGSWAARELDKESWDVVHCWSGVSEELLQGLQGGVGLTSLVRASSHIRAQARILMAEEQRAGTSLDKPSTWIVGREEREYALADRIVVPASFVVRSFIAEGVRPDKLDLLPLGTDVSAFSSPAEVVEARCRRILDGEPLRVLYVGTLSYRKGLLDMAAIVRALHRERFEFRFVGAVPREARRIVSELSDMAVFVPSQPQQELPDSYAWGDVFCFPTIEDGFPVVLTQAQASALPILTTAHCSGPDIIRDGQTGWVLPVRSPGAFIDRLRWCETNREALSEMVRLLAGSFRPRDWSEVGADFERLCIDQLQRSTATA